VNATVTLENIKTMAPGDDLSKPLAHVLQTYARAPPGRRRAVL
jgi:hypothetical protein